MEKLINFEDAKTFLFSGIFTLVIILTFEFLKDEIKNRKNNVNKDR